MPRFLIFTGPPSVQELIGGDAAHTQYHWTVSACPAHRASQPIMREPPVLPYALPPATLASANRKISLLYENIIFDEDVSEDVAAEQELDAPGDLSVRADQTTLISWPPTEDPNKPPEPHHPGSCSAISFLRPAASIPQLTARSQYETQETQEDTASFDHSDAESSIARFPTFHFSLNRVTPLSALQSPSLRPPPPLGRTMGPPPPPLLVGPGPSTKVTVLAAVLEVDGPDAIRVKKGPDAGKEVSILKLIIGDEDGIVCKLTAWRQVAELWGGGLSGAPYGDGDSPSRSMMASAQVPCIKRGDVVLFENVLVSTTPTTSAGTSNIPSTAAATRARNTMNSDHKPSLHAAVTGASSLASALTSPRSLALTASPNVKSRMEICYRTMPNGPEDARRLRPDLRLGITDSSVRKVASVVHWFESMAGLA